MGVAAFLVNDQSGPTGFAFSKAADVQRRQESALLEGPSAREQVSQLLQSQVARHNIESSTSWDCASNADAESDREQGPRYLPCTAKEVTSSLSQIEGSEIAISRLFGRGKYKQDPGANTTDSCSGPRKRLRR